ncbi:MAG: hypothetical protein IK076_07310 [Bacteroidales bacterium]|nr:hypothetical protein [Bacteroidales bacterium]
MFYNIKDSLVFFTIFMLVAEKYGIRVSGLCLMYNHYHVDFEAERPYLVSRFISEFCTMFSKTYNHRYGFSGHLFDRHGISNKWGDKSKRTAYAYLYNNPVEWHLCSRAEEYRWNFLRYSQEDNPFSKKIASRNMTVRLRKALNLVRYLRSKRRPILYETLDNILDPLDTYEKQYLVDFIVNEYSVIDYHRAVACYGSYQKMTDAFSNNTGNEYDIDEEFDPSAGKDYRKMAVFLARDKRYKDIGEVVHRPAEERLAYLNEIVEKCGVSVEHARKFLRIDVADLINDDHTHSTRHGCLTD